MYEADYFFPAAWLSFFAAADWARAAKLPEETPPPLCLASVD
jgi:hypothetical protein